MVPSSAMKAAVRGSRVFFIQKHWLAGCSNTKSMPSLAAMSLRCIRPVARCSGVAATWAWIRCMPADKVMRGSCNCGWLSAQAPRHTSPVRVAASQRRAVENSP